MGRDVGSRFPGSTEVEAAGGDEGDAERRWWGCRDRSRPQRRRHCPPSRRPTVPPSPQTAVGSPPRRRCPVPPTPPTPRPVGRGSAPRRQPWGRSAPWRRRGRQRGQAGSRSAQPPAPSAPGAGAGTRRLPPTRVCSRAGVHIHTLWKLLGEKCPAPRGRAGPRPCGRAAARSEGNHPARLQRWQGPARREVRRLQ